MHAFSFPARRPAQSTRGLGAIFRPPSIAPSHCPCPTRSIPLRCAVLLFITENMAAWCGNRSSTFARHATSPRVNNAECSAGNWYSVVASLPYLLALHSTDRRPCYGPATSRAVSLLPAHSTRRFLAVSFQSDATLVTIKQAYGPRVKIPMLSTRNSIVPTSN